ncbi:MAG: M48 family metalloprotease [Granulosicoccus sp.]|nr:M48 family metalloprotease [Granulosicoccus sp.]
MIKNNIQFIKVCLASLLSVVLLVACAKNPVTGKNDLLLVSEDWELQVGAQQYLPLRQQQGGDYVVDPSVENYVRSVGKRLAMHSDRKLPYEFNVINDSTPNAWALPGGKISINRGLLVELESEAELAAVLGHEIVHAAAKHGAKGQTRGVGLQLGVMTASLIGGRNGYGQEVQMLSTVGAQIINSQYGQGAELESDHYGMRYMAAAGYDPRGAVDLQRTFVKLSKGRANNTLSRLFASHPPSEKRVEENIKTAAGLKKGGKVGKEEYRKQLARLFKTEKAYESFDKAREALKNGNTSQAQSLINQAVKIEPREAHFHTLMGDIALMKKDLGAAKKSYDKAIGLNGEYFYSYLQRGRVNDAQRNPSAARADYARSMKLLPTSTAQMALGQFAEREGKPGVARRFYAMAAQARGTEAEKARQALVRLQPQAAANGSVAASVNKDSRLLVRQGVNREGEFVVELINQTPRPLTDIKLGMQARAGTGQVVQVVERILKPGERYVHRTGRNLTREQAGRVRIVVLDSAIAR